MQPQQSANIEENQRNIQALGGNSRARTIGNDHVPHHIWITDPRQQEILRSDRLEFDRKWLELEEDSLTGN